ncbi:alpha-2-macroglobulin-like [Thomomys bottae]
MHDVELTGRASSSITTTITKLSFVQVDPHFRRGIPFFAQVRLEDGKGHAMPGQLVFITAPEANHRSNATTDQHGLVQLSINTTSITGNHLTLTVKHKDVIPCYSGYRWVNEDNQEAHHTATSVFSHTKSFVRLEPLPSRLRCGQARQVQVHYIVSQSFLPDLKELAFYYVIMAKGSIVWTGFHKQPVENKDDLKGQFPVSLPVGSELAPIARLLIFSILPDGEMFGDSAKYEIEYCLDNKVDLSFSQAQQPPASLAHLRLLASPQSLCALRAVDQSVLLLKPEAKLSATSVYELLPVKDLNRFPDTLDQQEDTGECVAHQNVYINGIPYAPVSNSDEKDMYMFLQDMGLKVFTNSQIHKPKVCIQTQEYPAAYARYAEPVALSHRGAVPMVMTTMDVVDRASGAPETTMRTYFPETWIWDLQRLESVLPAQYPHHTRPGPPLLLLLLLRFYG